MPAPVVLFSSLVGFGLVIVAGAWLHGDSHVGLSGLFPAQGRNDWPRGVQEGDVPHFAVEHVDSLRPATAADLPSNRELDDVESALRAVKPVKLRVRILDAHR